MHRHPYPTRFHGAQYERYTFGFPQVAKPQYNFVPGYDIDGTADRPIEGFYPPGSPGLSGEVPSGGDHWNAGQGIFRPGGYGGGVFDNNLSGLGSTRKRSLRGLGADDTATYPWRQYSDATKKLQQVTNESLIKAGLCPIDADGKLGGATCGARNHLSVNSEKYFGQLMAFNSPAACEGHVSEFKVPTPKSQGCGGGGSVPLPQPVQPSTDYASAGMSSSTKRALGFAAGGIIAIAAVMVLRKGH
jgi:hypothetical protein